MSIAVRHEDNVHWGLHVFFEGAGGAKEIRGASPPLHSAVLPDL